MMFQQKIIQLPQQLVKEVKCLRGHQMLVLTMNKPARQKTNKFASEKQCPLSDLSHLFLLCLPRMSENLGSSSIWYLSRYSYNSSVPNTLR